MTADWCGDAMLCVPILMRVAEAAGMELRFLIRDENLELMDQYLTNGKSRSIPIFIFIDADGKERAVWGPRAPEVQRLIEEMRASLPPKDDPQFEEETAGHVPLLQKAPVGRPFPLGCGGKQHPGPAPGEIGPLRRWNWFGSGRSSSVEAESIWGKRSDRGRADRAGREPAPCGCRREAPRAEGSETPREE